MAHLWRWYQGLAGRERGLATAFVAIIVGTLPCYAFGVALLFAAPSPSRAAAPVRPAAAAAPTAPAPSATPVPPPTARPPTRPAPATAAPVPAISGQPPAAKPPHQEASRRAPRGNARGHDR
ncbi:MAG TPA: hypothetical protein VFE37_27980 [Chloroflexota bacterium]|nr:hypothetical protein [Chloroflexota bacterium]